MNLRPPTIPFERMKRTMVLAILGVALEYVDPLPFFKSPAGWLLYFIIFTEVVRQFATFLMENRMPAVMRAEAYKKKWEVHELLEAHGV